MRIRVPASSANLGPGFDVLGLALTIHMEVATDGPPVPDTHPAVVAFRRAGGEGTLSVSARFPGGRGLGFSGAAHVAGALAASVQRGGTIDSARDEVLALASELEGHAENAAASLHGGVVAVAGGRVQAIPLGLDPDVVVWVPDAHTSTRGSRARLPAEVRREDAVFNIGRTAVLVAALAAGDAGALRVATEDRLHQDARLARAPGSAEALRTLRAHGAWGAWLSGSGPSVAAFVPRDAVAGVVAALEATGRVLVLGIDRVGAVDIDAPGGAVA